MSGVDRVRRIGGGGLQARGSLAGVLLAASIGIGLGGAGGSNAAGAPSAGSQASVGERDADRQDLEHRLAELEAAVASLKADLERFRVGQAPALTSVADLEKKIEALTLEIERLRLGEAAVPLAKTAVGGFGPAASKVYGTRKGVSLGGYGEMLYQNFEALADDSSPSRETDEVDFLRSVLYFGYRFDGRLLFNSEIEYEHAEAGEGEAGEVAVEFAYLDFRASGAFGLRGGLLLLPIGLVNELHEPPIFHGAQRPDVERFVIPSTWRENGVGIYGEAGPVSYRACLVAGLKATGFSAAQGIRGGRQGGARSIAEDLGASGRVDWTPIPGFLVGGSAFTSRVGQGAAGLRGARLTLWDAHAEWNRRGLHLRGLYARSILSDAEAVSAASDPDPADLFVPAIGERIRGWYGEIAFNVLARYKRSEQELIPFLRYEALDTQAEVAPGAAADPANDRTVRVYGLTYRPIPNVAVKVDLQDRRNKAGTGVDQVNLALGYLF